MEKKKISVWLSNHGEWASLMAVMMTGIGLGIKAFLLCHAESVALGQRIDATMQSTQNQIASINQRADDLHREFYELLKEMRAERNAK